MITNVLQCAAAHGMFPGPAEGARTAFEDAHQLSILLHEAFSSSTPEAALVDALKRFPPQPNGEVVGL